MPRQETPFPAPPWVVLDTNAVLDWLLFRDPRFTRLAAALHAGQLRWAQTEPMAVELKHMLAHAWPDRWNDRSVRLLSYGLPVTATRVGLPLPAWRPGLRCTDPDDQVFIDLALALPARWLVSRDKAVLKLARKAAPLGVSILPPEDWPGLG